MRKNPLSYVKIDEIDMQKLDYMLLIAVGETDIKKFIQKENKLKSIMMQIKLKGKVDESLLREIALNMEEYFQFYTALGNHFLDRYSKKYEGLAQQFVDLSTEEYDSFLVNKLQQNELPHFITMVRFLKQSAYYEQLHYLLQYEYKGNQIVQQKGEDMNIPNDLQNKKNQITSLLDDLFDAIHDEKELKHIEEKELYAKKIKTLEKKISTQQKELEIVKSSLLQEQKLFKESKEKSNQLNNELSNLAEALKKAQEEIAEEREKYNQIISKAKDHKTELVMLKGKYEKQLFEKDHAATKEKEQTDKMLNELQEQVNSLTKQNEKLKTKVKNIETEKEALITTIQVLEQEKLSKSKSLIQQDTFKETNPSVTRVEQPYSKEEATVQQANTALLATVGFGNDVQEDMFDDDDVLFGLDDNKPQLG